MKAAFFVHLYLYMLQLYLIAKKCLHIVQLRKKEVFYMKKTYLSPEVKVNVMFDVIMMSTTALDLGGGDWGVEDVL